MEKNSIFQPKMKKEKSQKFEQRKFKKSNVMKI